MLARWGVPTLAEDACLVVSELVSNAVLHVTTPDGTPMACRLALKLFTEALAIELRDPSSDTDLRPRRADTMSESGRGLAIVESLCGMPPLVFTGPGAGKTVVAILSRPTLDTAPVSRRKE